jgi:hypothetical protein
MRAEYSPAAQPGVVTLRMDACGFFVERRFGIELNINPVEMALVEFPPLDGTRPRLQPLRTRTVPVPMESSISREASPSGVRIGTKRLTMRRARLRIPRDPRLGQGVCCAVGRG